MKKFTVDARNLPCPRPLLKTKEALEKENFQILEILVNNSAARENVCRFLNKAGVENIQWQDNPEENSSWIITAEPGNFESSSDGTRRETPLNLPKGEMRLESCTPPLEGMGEAPKTIMIGAPEIGRGNGELGKLLMKGFIYTLTQLDSKPECLIFMNGGVSLACSGSESLKDLETLEKDGCRILVCGTCLDYLKLSGEKKIGTVSNMYEIAGQLMDQANTLTLT